MPKYTLLSLVVIICLLSIFIMPNRTEATTISASELIQITGTTTQDTLSTAIETGDFNGDGYDDLILGAFNALTGETRNGAAYIIYGSATALTSQSISSEQIIQLSGESAWDWAGISVASAGDLNADGYDEILIGAPQHDSAANASGAAYILYGSATPVTSDSLSTAIKLTGTQAIEYFGYTVSDIGDINGDGYDDAAFGSLFYDSDVGNTGAVYVLYGRADQYTSANIETIGIRINGEHVGDALGGAMSCAGDMNNDGFDDWLVGAYGYDGSATDVGAVYILYGNSARITTGSIDRFIRLTGESANDAVGYSMAPAGDLNGDTYADAVIGAAYVDSNGANAGSLYVLYGSSALYSSQSLAFAPEIVGSESGDSFGYLMSGNRDLNQDGYSDLIVTAPYNNTAANSAGAAYIIDGSSTQWSSGSINTIASATFTGEIENDRLGSGVTFADLNGDTIAEVIIAAPYHGDTNTNLAGTVYIGYVRIDQDSDGVLGEGGLLEIGTDCNDNDATVSSIQTYYEDSDSDGLGVPISTIHICSSTPPAGYCDNALDTNDTIVNNGVEINNDGIDNDGDGVIDEANTLDENTAHPEYGVIDPTDADAINHAIVSVRSTKKGRIEVTFADQSIYRYTVFKKKQKKPLRLIQYPDTGYYIAMSATGKRLALVNVLNGDVVDRTIFKGKTYTKHYLQFANIRGNAVQEVIIASKNRSLVRLAFVGVNLSTHQFVHKKSTHIKAPAAKLSYTIVVGNTIDIRSRRMPLYSFFVTKKYQLTIVKK